MKNPEQIADQVMAWPGEFGIKYDVYQPNEEQVRAIVLRAIELAREA